MAVFNEPTKWQTSLVNSGDANVIPQSTPVGTGEASFDDGFPQITQIPIGAGGIAPDRKDFNGLFKILGDWIFFNQNGGVSTYSENFDYVAGRVVSYNDNIYKCIQANGVSSTVVTPDSNTEYWQRLDNFVRSVNGVNADASGNVTINASSVEESWTNDYNGYRIYSDGFCEQWGFVSETRNAVLVTVNLHKAYKDTNYNLNTEVRTKDSTNMSSSVETNTNVQSITTTGFKVNLYETDSHNMRLGFYWHTWGYIR